MYNFRVNRGFSASDTLILGYHIYLKYSNTSTIYNTSSKIWTSTIYYPMLCLKIAGWVANSVDPDEMPHSAASHLGLHCLLKPVWIHMANRVTCITKICKESNKGKKKIATDDKIKSVCFFLLQYVTSSYTKACQHLNIRKGLICHANSKDSDQPSHSYSDQPLNYSLTVSPNTAECTNIMEAVIRMHWSVFSLFAWLNDPFLFL